MARAPRDRALAHKDAVRRGWSTFLEEDPYDARLSVDDDGSGELWIEQRRPVPPLIGIEFREYLYNLRAALDHLAYAVAVADSKQDPPHESAGWPDAFASNWSRTR